VPETGPDFAFHLEYIPDQHHRAQVIECTSGPFERGAFHEAVTNRMLSDLVSPVNRFMRLQFKVRGGVYTDVVAEHRQAGWRLTSFTCPDALSAGQQHSAPA
jgi:7-cyano-7-deazaguanine reductase